MAHSTASSKSSFHTSSCCARLYRNCSGRIRAEPTRPRKSVLAGRVHPQVILPPVTPCQSSSFPTATEERRQRLVCLRRPVIYVVRVYRKRQRRRPTEKAQALEIRNSWVEGRPTTADQLVGVHTAEIALGVAPPPIIHRNSGMSKIERITGTALSISLYNEPMDCSRRTSMESITRESYQPSFSVRTMDLNSGAVTRSDIPISPTTSELSDISDVSTRTHQLAPPPPASFAQCPGLTALSRVNSVTVRNPPHIATQYTPPRFQRRRSSSVQFPRRKSSDPSLPRRKSSLASEYTINTSAFGRSNSTVSGMTSDSRPISSIHPLPTARNTSQHRRSWSGRSILLLDNFTEPQAPPHSTAAPPPLQIRKPGALAAQLSIRIPPEPPHLPPVQQLTRTYSTISIISDPSTISSLSLGGASFRGLSPRPQTIDTDAELEEEMTSIRERARRNSDERRRRRRVEEEREIGRRVGDDREDRLRPAREGFRFV